MIMKKYILTITFSLCSLLLVSCSQKENALSDSVSENTISLYEDDVATSSITLTGVRDNTPVCFVPVASNVKVYSNKLAEIDVSNSSEGYFMVNYKGKNPKVRLLVTGPDEVRYTYNLYNGYEAFPLSAGSGTYKIGVYENIRGSEYSPALYQTVDVTITNTFGPNLYSNQYVKFDTNSKVVAKAMELAQYSNNDLDVIDKVYNYCTTNITYDHNKAATVQSGYTSNPDDILESGTGICLDYAAVMASMLRSQGIPTRLEVGYAGTAYHAWISAYINEIGWVNGIIQFDGVNWSIMDPTFGANSDKEVLKNFIGNGSNYKTKYIY